MKDKFVVNNKIMANAILCLTGIRYETVATDNGSKFLFPREKYVFEAYDYIQDFRNNGNKIY